MRIVKEITSHAEVTEEDEVCTKMYLLRRGTCFSKYRQGVQNGMMNMLSNSDTRYVINRPTLRIPYHCLHFSGFTGRSTLTIPKTLAELFIAYLKHLLYICIRETKENKINTQNTIIKSTYLG